MKQKDIALIVVVIFVSIVVSIVLSNMLISSPKNRQQEVEIIDPISASFPLPDERYFNENSVNPTQLIQIGDDSNNTKPFENN